MPPPNRAPTCLPAGLLYIGVDGPLQTCKPGNGGLRIWPYPAADAAVAECRVLASTMSMKHSVFNTGFSGAKLVLNATDLLVRACLSLLLGMLGCRVCAGYGPRSCIQPAASGSDFARRD